MKTQIKDLLERALWTFLQGFLGTFVTLAPGLLTAPNLGAAKAAAIAVIVGSLAGGLSALKTYIKERLA